MRQGDFMALPASVPEEEKQAASTCHANLSAHQQMIWLGQAGANAARSSRRLVDTCASRPQNFQEACRAFAG